MTVWFLRLTLLLHAVLAVAQPVLAGSYLSGQYDSIGWHSAVGSALPATLMLAGGAALLHWTAGRGAGWPFFVTVALFFAEGIQIGMGYTRTMAVHIPLGVAIVGVSVALAGWSFSRSSRWQRPRQHTPTGLPA